MTEILIQAVLRNTATRKDAAYILEAHHATTTCSDHDGVGYTKEYYLLMAYWGRWDTYAQHGTARLQSQQKFLGAHLSPVRGAMSDILLQKLGKGYVVQEEYSQTPGWYVDQHGYIMRRGKPLPKQAPVTEVKAVPEPCPVSRWSVLEL